MSDGIAVVVDVNDCFFLKGLLAEEQRNVLMVFIVPGVTFDIGLGLSDDEDDDDDDDDDEEEEEEAFCELPTRSITEKLP